MTFNSSQQERLLTALERIADALEKQARPAPFLAPVTSRNDLRRGLGLPEADTDPNSTKGPYR